MISNVAKENIKRWRDKNMAAKPVVLNNALVTRAGHERFLLISLSS